MQEVSKLEGEVLLITHKNCKDGLGCAMAMTKYANEHPGIELEIHYVAYDDGSELPSVIGKHVIMADFSYSRHIVEEMHRLAKSFIVLDHHKSARDALGDLDYCYIDMSKSGAMITWEYLYPNESAPSIIKYIQDRDLWALELDLTKELTAAFAMCDNDEVLDNIYYYMSEECVETLQKEGAVVIKYQNAMIDRIIKKVHKLPKVVVGGFTVPCFNNDHLISEVGNAITEYYPFSLQYYIINDRIKFSLRSNLKSPHGFVDVEVIAKSFGGGGHPKAAGFSLALKDFNYNDLFVSGILNPK